MRATDIRIKLVKPNTFGDQYFSSKDNDVLKTYYYAISDLSVGGRYESTESSKQPIITHYLGHMPDYQRIRGQYFLIRSEVGS